MSVEQRDADFGVVRAIQSDSISIGAGTRYGVEILTPGECTTCALVENCHGVGALVWAISATTLRVGQSVQLEVPAGTVLRVTGWVYGIPLAAVVSGVLLAYLWFFARSPENSRVLLSAATGFASLLAAGGLMSRLNRPLTRQLTPRAAPAPPGAPDKL